MKYFILSFFLLLSSLHLFAQNYDTRFQISSINCETNEVCYNVQLRPNGAGSFNLAGQNYRIYYNSFLAAYTTGRSLLPSQYGEFTLRQNIQDVDASSMSGPLSFESTLGFLNYFVDLNDVQNGGISLIANQWTSTTNICFEVEDEVLSNINSCLEIVWAREGLTDVYATAFVEVSRWVTTNNTTNSRGIIYDDLDADDGAAACLVLNCQPTAVSVSDLSVNESMGNVQIQVCIPTVTTEDVTVNFSTSDSTAISPSDYSVVLNGILTIPVGQTCTSILIPIINDTISEGNEQFFILLSSPSSNATLGDRKGVVTILDDEEIPTVTIADANVSEDSLLVNLPVCLSGLSSLPTTMIVNTTNGSAVSDSDFEALSDFSFSIPAGVLCGTIQITITDDSILEATETFNVLLTNISTNALLLDGSSLVTINDNDILCRAKAPTISGN